MLSVCASVVFFFKQKTAYEMRISDWSSDVCSSDLLALDAHFHRLGGLEQQRLRREHMLDLARPDAEGERADSAMARGVAVAADDRRAGQRKALFGADDMDDALLGRIGRAPV